MGIGHKLVINLQFLTHLFFKQMVTNPAVIARMCAIAGIRLHNCPECSITVIPRNYLCARIHAHDNGFLQKPLQLLPIANRGEEPNGSYAD